MHYLDFQYSTFGFMNLPPAVYDTLLVPFIPKSFTERKKPAVHRLDGQEILYLFG